jgi:hypothetical protein
MKQTFYRVGDIHTKQGLWYDQQGEFTGFIHGPLNFCANSDLQMPFTPEIVGYLSATKTIEELFAWFPPEDIARLETLGFFILKYEAFDYKYHANHWAINQETSELTGFVLLESIQLNNLN